MFKILTMTKCGEGIEVWRAPAEQARVKWKRETDAIEYASANYGHGLIVDDTNRAVARI